MATKLWRTVKGGSTASRLFSAYLALALVVAVAGPGLAVYASESASVPEAPVDSSSVEPEAVVEESASEIVSVPEVSAEPAVEQPAAAPEVSLEPAVTVSAEPVLVPAVLPSATVVPVLSPDHNPPLTAGGVRIEDPTTGTYTPSNVSDSKPVVPADYSIQLTTYETDEGWFFDFVSNYPILKVVVKGGTGGAYIYTYNPAVFSDTGLHTPANPNGKFAGLSHVDFYFGTISEPEPGNLTVHKFQDDNQNGQFEPGLGEVMLDGWMFTLYDSSDAMIDSGLTAGGGSLLFADLEAGDYSVTETLEDGWINTTPLTQSVTVTEGGEHELWFGNVPEPQGPESGEIVVHKFQDDNENGIFEANLGEVMLEGWEFTLYDVESQLDSGLTDADGMVLFASLQPGDYSVTETLQEGWTNTTPLTQEAAVSAGQTTHVWFGNVEESLPFTELDLAITKLADKSSAKPGELITYTLTYRNLGDLPAEGYTIVDDFDERYVSVVDANGGVVSGGKITWTFAGPLTKEDGPRTLTYSVRVKTDMPVGSTAIDNVVVISHPLDENPANNRDDARVVVVVTAVVTNEPFLPFTGGEYLLLLVAGLFTGLVGLALRVRTQTA